MAALMVKVGGAGMVARDDFRVKWSDWSYCPQERGCSKWDTITGMEGGWSGLATELILF